MNLLQSWLYSCTIDALVLQIHDTIVCKKYSLVFVPELLAGVCRQETEMIYPITTK